MSESDCGLKKKRQKLEPDTQFELCTANREESAEERPGLEELDSWIKIYNMV